MQTEPENQPYPVGFLVFAVVATCWIVFWPHRPVHQGGYTVRAQNHAQIKAPKEGLLPPYMLEDAIKERLRARPAKFKR